MTKARQPEEQLQRACVEYLRKVCPPPPVGAIWTAVNPVPAKSKAAAGISKAMGLLAGWPDLCFVHKGKFVGVELKASKGKLSPAQRECHYAILAAGGHVFTIRTLDGFADLMGALGIGPKVHHPDYDPNEDARRSYDVYCGAMRERLEAAQ